MEIKYKKLKSINNIIYYYIKYSKNYKILKINNIDNWINIKHNEYMIEDYDMNMILTLIENIAFIIGKFIYNDDYNFLENGYSNNELYIVSNKSINLINWKYVDEKSFILRYNLFGFVNYLHIELIRRSHTIINVF